MEGVCFSVRHRGLHLAAARFSLEGSFQRRDPAASSVFAITHPHTPQLWRPAALQRQAAPAENHFPTVCGAASALQQLRGRLKAPRRRHTSYKALHGATAALRGPSCARASWKITKCTDVTASSLQLTEYFVQLDKTTNLN